MSQKPSVAQSPQIVPLALTADTGGRSGPAHNVTFELPPGCKLEGAATDTDERLEPAGVSAKLGHVGARGDQDHALGVGRVGELVEAQDGAVIHRAERRLAQMLAEGEGRAALVDLGMRNGIITPVTSFYVPTRAEMPVADRQELEQVMSAVLRASRQMQRRHAASAKRDGVKTPA